MITSFCLFVYNTFFKKGIDVIKKEALEIYQIVRYLIEKMREGTELWGLCHFFVKMWQYVSPKGPTLQVQKIGNMSTEVTMGKKILGARIENTIFRLFYIEQTFTLNQITLVFH